MPSRDPRRPRRARSRIAADIYTYAKLVAAQDDLGAKLRATYTDANACLAIVKDGLHLADALVALLGTTKAAIGTRARATSDRDDAMDALARWLHRWVLVAHHVLGPADRQTLGIAGARHHPAHRAKHPAGEAPAPPAAS